MSGGDIFDAAKSLNRQEVAILDLSCICSLCVCVWWGGGVWGPQIPVITAIYRTQFLSCWQFPLARGHTHDTDDYAIFMRYKCVILRMTMTEHNNLSACCALEGKTATEEAAQASTQKN